jgi:uncharacterized membrane protein
VCGWSDSLANPNERAWLWTNGETMELPIPGPSSQAEDINNRSQVCGWLGIAPFSDFYSEAFVWNNGRLTMLGMPGGAINSEAKSINNMGDVCGVYTVPTMSGSSFVRRSFFWSAGVFTDLGMLPDFDSCVALAVNDHRQVIGYCGNVEEPFIWDNGVMTRLRDVVDGGSIEMAWAINNLGQIAGDGRIGTTGERVAVLLSPLTPVEGDVNCDRIVDINLRDGERANHLIDRLHEQRIPVVVITGYTEVALPPGKVEAILQKPVSVEKFLAILCPIIARQKER